MMVLIPLINASLVKRGFLSYYCYRRVPIGLLRHIRVIPFSLLSVLSFAVPSYTVMVLVLVAGNIVRVNYKALDG